MIPPITIIVASKRPSRRARCESDEGILVLTLSRVDWRSPAFEFLKCLRKCAARARRDRAARHLCPPPARCRHESARTDRRCVRRLPWRRVLPRSLLALSLQHRRPSDKQRDKPAAGRHPVQLLCPPTFPESIDGPKADGRIVRATWRAEGFHPGHAAPCHTRPRRRWRETNRGSAG